MSFTLDEMTDRIRGAMNPDPNIGKTIKFDLKGDGIIHIDGSNVTNEDKPADLTMGVFYASWRLGNRRRDHRPPIPALAGDGRGRGQNRLP